MDNNNHKPYSDKDVKRLLEILGKSENVRDGIAEASLEFGRSEQSVKGKLYKIMQTSKEYYINDTIDALRTIIRLRGELTEANAKLAAGTYTVTNDVEVIREVMIEPEIQEIIIKSPKAIGSIPIVGNDVRITGSNFSFTFLQPEVEQKSKEEGAE